MGAAGGLALYALLAYTREGLPGDPFNLVVAGDPEALAEAFEAAGWTRAERMSPRSAGRAFLLKTPYPSAPVSALFWGGRRQDLSFELDLGPGDRARHHVRLWRVPGPRPDGLAEWVGAASFDRGVKVDRRTGRLTHRIDQDVDAEREFVARSLRGTGALAGEVLRPGPARIGRNGGGDPYRTDGAVRVLTLRRV
ncbi:MAG: LssY C-terminal domain-containing protein [Elusimicrobia bacterium]|nr:LssY C-terminal domain-containing protein [Elusimicrobiota bacterium]